MKILEEKGIEKVVPTLIPCYQTIQNDYLYSKGFSRDLNYNAKVNRNMYLSERDIVHYGFIKACKKPEDVETRLAENGVDIADPYIALGVYRKLAFEGIDSEAKTEKKSSVNKNMFSSLS